MAYRWEDNDLVRRADLRDNYSVSGDMVETIHGTPAVIGGYTSMSDGFRQTKKVLRKLRDILECLPEKDRREIAQCIIDLLNCWLVMQGQICDQMIIPELDGLTRYHQLFFGPEDEEGKTDPNKKLADGGYQSNMPAPSGEGWFPSASELWHIGADVSKPLEVHLEEEGAGQGDNGLPVDHLPHPDSEGADGVTPRRQSREEMLKALKGMREVAEETRLKMEERKRRWMDDNG